MNFQCASMRTCELTPHEIKKLLVSSFRSSETRTPHDEASFGIETLAWPGNGRIGRGRMLERTPGATREFISQCRKRARTYLAEWHALAFTAGNADG